MTERLKQQPLDKAQLLLLHQMNQMLDRINWLITTLLKMSKLEAGSITYQFTNVKMKDFLQEALNPMAISMDLRGQTCKISCDDAISFSCDRTWTLEAISMYWKTVWNTLPMAEHYLWQFLKQRSTRNFVSSTPEPVFQKKIFRICLNGFTAVKMQGAIALALDFPLQG